METEGDARLVVELSVPIESDRESPARNLTGIEPGA